MRYQTTLAWILLCIISGSLHAAPSTQPARFDPVARAVQVLTREARDAIRLKKPFPRTESDYFIQSPAKVDVVKLFEALIRPGSQPALIDGYVKWQLLSILPKRLGPEFERAGAKVLLFAPPIAPLPGATSASRAALNKQVGQIKREEIDAFNQSFQTTLDEERQRVNVIVRFRRELSMKLPIAEQCLKARLDELWTRGSYGFEIETEAKRFFADVGEWKSSADPKQVGQMAKTIADYAARPQPVLFDHLEWNADESRAVWMTKNTGFDAVALRELAIELDPSLAN